MAEDLVQETYLSMVNLKEDVVIRYKDHLSVKVLFVMSHLFCRRNASKFRSDGSTSPLKELSGLIDVEGLDVGFDKPMEDLIIMNESIELLNDKICRAMLTQNEGSNEDSDFMKVSTFLQSIESPVSEISRKTGIPRYYVTRLVKAGKLHLEQAIK